MRLRWRHELAWKSSGSVRWVHELRAELHRGPSLVRRLSVKKRSRSVQMRRAISSVSSNFMVEPTASTSTIAHSGLVDLVVKRLQRRFLCEVGKLFVHALRWLY